MNSKFIWVDGKLVPFKKATVHLLNHSLHYGSAVFEGVRFYNTKNGPSIFRLDEHIKRLMFSAKVMGMKVPYSLGEIKKATLTLVGNNKLSDGYIRPIIFYGSKMGLDPTGADLHVAIACWSWGKYLTQDVVKVKISRFRRLGFQNGEMEAKVSGYYFNSIMAGLEAKKAGYDEALLLDLAGNIAEGPGENIFFVKGNVIHTPIKGSILPGITRDSIIQLAKSLGYKINERKINPREIKNFDEAFFTGTAVEVVAIGQIDKTKINNGKEGEVTKKIKDLYHKVITGEAPKYKKWLTLVNEK